ncbi:MAG: PHP domain-containing protein, partial [Myxococcota bacterium]
MSERYDFHTHTHVSDGSLSPAELVRAAALNRVTAFALTDHDTTDGVAAAQAEGRALGVEVIAGIELSVSEQDGALALHILGLGLDPDDAALRARLEVSRHGRSTRAARIVAHLQALVIA